MTPDPSVPHPLQQELLQALQDTDDVLSALLQQIESLRQALDGVEAKIKDYEIVHMREKSH